jgi:hypothetical protein
VHIDWASLAEVAIVAAAAAVSVVCLVAFALVGLSSRAERGRGSVGSHADLGTAVAAVCLLAAGLVVGYGLYTIIT